MLQFRRAKLALVLFALFLVGIIVLADTGMAPGLFAKVRSVPGGDKIGHFILFGTLSFLLNVVFRVARFHCHGLSLLKGSAILTVLVSLEECSQLLFNSRTFDFGDLAANVLGIWLFGQIAVFYLWWKQLQHDIFLATESASKKSRDVALPATPPD